MGEPLRVLIVTDNEDDTRVMLRELINGGYNTTHARVDSAEDMSTALNSQRWDVILSDYVVPHFFSAPEALMLLRKSEFNVPLIVVSGIGAEGAVEATMKGCADGYIKKNNLAQLAPAVERALEEAKARQLHKQADKAVREGAERFRRWTNATSDAIVMADSEGRISFWNEAAERMFHYTKDEAVGRYLHKLIIPERYREKHLRGFKTFIDTGDGPVIGKTLELAAIKRDGTEFPIELFISAIRTDGRWNAMGIVRDIAERKGLEEALKRALEERDDSTEKMKQLMDFSDLMREGTQEVELLRHMTQVFKRQFLPDIIAIFLLDREKDTLKVGLIDPPMPEGEFLKAETLADPSVCRVIRTGHEFIVRDINKEPSCDCVIHKIEEGGYACFPLIVGGVTIGTIVMVKKDMSYWDEETYRLMSAYMGIAANALHRVRVLDVT